MDRYLNTPSFLTIKGNEYKGTTKYPDLPLSFNDIYVYTDEGDRFDILAQNYYGDSTLWWLISIANPQLDQNSIYPPMGIQIRIPQDVGRALSIYSNFNEN